MGLDPQVKALLDTIEESGAPPIHTLPIPVARQLAAGFAAMGIAPEPVAHVDNIGVPCRGGSVDVRVYRPGEGDRYPALVFLHGSGWIYGDLEMSDSICRRLANVAQCVVVAPDYRLAPEHKFPAALEDAYDVAKWLADHAADLKVDPDRIAVGGESAGGNLAAAVCLAARDAGTPSVRLQFLVCPVLDNSFDTASYEEFADGYILTRDGMRWLWSQYLESAADGDQPYASPSRTDDLSGLPAALILTAEFDPLRDEGEQYGQALRAAGVPANVRRHDGQIHGFMTLAGVVDAARAAIDEAASDLATALGGPGVAS